MCPRTDKQFEEIRESKRSQIIDAALECFATRGYHAVSISELADFAGISKGLMYNYFKSKDELLKSIFKQVMSVMLQLFDPDKKGLPGKEELEKYLDRYFNHLKSNIILWKMYMAVFSQPAVQEILKDEILEASRKPLEIMENYCKALGYKDPKAEVAFMSTLMSGVIFEYISDPENYPLDKIKKRILKLYQ
jgi:AcrR family transcriptional regulator